MNLRFQPTATLLSFKERSPEVVRYLMPVFAVGCLGGVIGFFYLALLKFFMGLLGPTPEHISSYLQLGIMVAVGVVLPIIIYWFGSPGNVELLVDNIHLRGGEQDLKCLRSLIPVSLLCISAGGAMGPEAPLVQTTGAVGSFLANRFGMPLERRRVLTITGMAAGFAVLFGAPFGAAIFSLEILHRKGLEYYEALIPAIVGALCGYLIYSVAAGMGITPIWQLPSLGNPSQADMGWAIVASLIGSGVAIAFIYINHFADHVFKKIPENMRPALGGAILALLALWSPMALTFGEYQLTQHVALAPAALGLLLTAAVAKFIGTTVTLGSGWKGGFIIPLFFIGAALGRVMHILIPSANEVVLMAAFMVSINTGVTKTPLGSALVVTKMAGILLLPSTIMAGIISLFATGSAGLIETQRDRKELSATSEPSAS